MHPTRPAILLAIALQWTAAAPPDDPQAALAVLASDAGVHDKARACQQLAVTGGPEAVPALAVLLGHEQLADYARSALELIADPAAGAALRDALPKLGGRLLAGAVDSLGVRRDAAAVPAIVALARDPGRGATDAALAALGRIANDEAVAALREVLTGGPDQLRVPAAHALLAAAGQLTRDGRPEAARGVLDAVAAAPGLPAHLKAAAAGPSAQTPTAPARRLFDGVSLAGWEGDMAWFRVVDGAVVAGSMEQPIPRNEFLCTTRDYGDFELRLKVRLAGGKGNGGIQLRSRRVPNSRELSGYQADMGEQYWGGLYDESRRNRFVAPPPDAATQAALVRPDDWNDYRIRCEGPRIRLWLNGRLTVDFTEADPAIPRRGVIALQIHGGPPAEASYRDLEIEELAGG